MNRKQFVIGAVGAGLLGLFSVRMARADDACTAPMSTWQSRHAVAEKARAMGWKVDRIRTDDGCYKVYGHDPKGKRIEAEFDPATLELIEIEGQDDHDDDSERSGGEKTGGEKPKAEGDH